MKSIIPSPATLRFASVLTHSDNRRICGSLSLAQISQSETSHIPGTLAEIPHAALRIFKNMKEIILRG